MSNIKLYVLSCMFPLLVSACASNGYYDDYGMPPLPQQQPAAAPRVAANYESRMPQHISTGEKTVLVDPNVHAWGAYSADGNLIRAGLATAGSDWCDDLGRPCRTRSGSFRIQSLGDAGCKSTRYPLPHGGAPMPYCMFFNGNLALHGSQYVMEANASHGCVRMDVQDAEWMRYNFANIGTKVIIRSY